MGVAQSISRLALIEMRKSEAQLRIHCPRQLLSIKFDLPRRDNCARARIFYYFKKYKIFFFCLQAK